MRWGVRTVVGSPEECWDYFDSQDGYDAYITGAVKEVRRVMKFNAIIWVIGTYHNIYKIGKIMQDLGFWILNNMI